MNCLQLSCLVFHLLPSLLPVFKQPGRISVEEPKQGLSPQGRGSTSTREFIAKYSLGNPVAGNFFQAEWDDYVPKLYKKLGG